MDAGVLDMLHHAADDDPLAVGNRVDVDFDRAVEITVDQQRTFFGGLQRLFEIAPQIALVGDNFHRASAQHVGRADQHRIADLGRARDRRLGVARENSARLAQASFSTSWLKRSRSSARSIASGGVPRIGTPARASGTASLSGVCPPNWTITPSGFSRSTIAHHVLERQRLEIEPVGNVVVGRDRLGIAVDHDGLEAVILQREAGMDAAVVELDSLPDPVRAAAEDYDLAPIVGRRFVLALVSRIEIRREGLEFGAAGIDRFMDRRDAEFAPAHRDCGFGDALQLSDPPIGKAHRFGLAQELGIERISRDPRLGRDDFGDRVDEPRIDLGQLMNLGRRDAEPQRVGRSNRSDGCWVREPRPNCRERRLRGSAQPPVSRSPTSRFPASAALSAAIP